MSDAPQHECRRGHRCQARVRDEERGMVGAGVERPNSLCHPCEDHAFAAIDRLADDWATLQAAVTAGRIRGAEQPRVTGTSGRPTPLQLVPEALAVAIETELLRWHRILTQGDPLPTPSGEAVQRCVAILATKRGTLVDLPARPISVMEPLAMGGDTVVTIVVDGVDAVLRLADLHRRSQQVLGLTRQIVWLPDPCHVCGRKALSASENQEYVRCAACHNIWDRDHFARLNDVLDYDRRTLRDGVETA